MPQNDKPKILIAPSDLAGVGHFRSIWLAKQMYADFKDKYYVEINAMPNYNDREYFKQFDIIHFHRQLGPYETMEVFFKELRDAGVTLIMDIDDFWIPPTTHPLYQAALKEKLAEKITKTFKLVDYVTTTTSIFAGYIKKYNPNVFVMPNGLDMGEKMWQDEETKKTDKVRISWIGGSSHLNDLEILKPSMKMLANDPELKDKYQIVMCGYDIRGHITQINPDGSQHTRKILPYETVWNRFEEIFTDNYNPNVVDEDYKNWLKKCKNEPYQNGDVYEKNYVRRWTLPLTQYGKHYNYCDICLAPLAENTFNEVKSELKIIESGMKRKALIAQDYSIYKELIKHNESGILINKPMSYKGWYVHLKKLILDNEFREKLANNLHEFVKDKYSLKSLTESRIQIYGKILAKKAAVSLETSDLAASGSGTAINR
jgi:glycosyltransferase involved in cell wall biosynthesis